MVMTLVQAIEQAVEAVRAKGYCVRMEWLGGAGGGAYSLGGKLFLLVDLGQSPAEQLATLRTALEASHGNPQGEKTAEMGWQPLSPARSGHRQSA